MTHHEPAEPAPEIDDGDVVSLLVHPALRADLWAWLDARGLRVDYAPNLSAGLATFLTSPKDERFGRA